MALDALTYAMAIFLEAYSGHAGDEGMAKAVASASADLTAFLRLVRRQSEAQGAHVLESISGDGHTTRQ